ncbi:MAG: NAD-dependent epimerase/dehydratase family protein [bacterium]|nr:NAD-dependent epimerase/dehydratase family protein [bacterium]
MTNAPLNILLIGASGFVSGTLARLAVGQGHRVWGITRGERELPEGVTGLRADRHDSAALERALTEAGVDTWDMVVDSIGYDPEDARQDVILFCERAKHFVFISTDFVFEPSKRTFPQSVDNPHFLGELYGGKKRLCELEFINGDTGAMAWTILRPCHIYGPGSLLGCLPEHGRDASLIETLRAGTPLRLVGGGHFLQQPIYAGDLARIALGCAGNPKASDEIFMTAGPDIVESRHFYQIIADILEVDLQVEEVPVSAYLAENPDKRSFLCHRTYSLDKLRDCGLPVPATRLEDGLRTHVQSVL